MGLDACVQSSAWRHTEYFPALRSKPWTPHPIILAMPTIEQSPGQGARPSEDISDQQNASYLGWVGRWAPGLV